MPDFNSEQEADAFWGPRSAEIEAAVEKCRSETGYYGFETWKDPDAADEIKTSEEKKAEKKAARKQKTAQNKCESKTVYVPGYGQKTRSEIAALWRDSKKRFSPPLKSGGGAGGGGGPAPYIPSKKPDPPPAPPAPKLVSFGKLFSTFCLPALTQVAYDEGLDEVQLNFYQLNESCGPISLHSVAEFPVEIAFAQKSFAEKCIERGGESMSVFEFLQWANSNLFKRNDAPGFAMRHIYEQQTEPKPEDSKKDAAAEDAKKLKKEEWFSKYGTFKPPMIEMRMAAVYEGKNSDTRIDLLYKLTHRLGGQFNPPPPRFQVTGDPESKTKRILRVDIYDKTYNPYEKTGRVFKDRDGSYKVFESGVSVDEARGFMREYARSYAGPGGPEIKEQPVPGSYNSVITIDDVTVSKTIPKGKNVLKDYLGSTVPVLTVGGTNSTLIGQAQFSSKTDGNAASIALTGGTYKAKSTLAPNALSMAENDLPIRALPAELQISTLGCPIAEARQFFFIDFGTGTTLDNMYSVRQLQHSFGPGRYETSWTFMFADGYSRFFGAAGIDDELKKMGESTQKLNDAKEAREEAASVEKVDFAKVEYQTPDDAKK